MRLFNDNEIRLYHAYEKVRKIGKYNMFNGQAIKATGLDRIEYRPLAPKYPDGMTV